MKKNAFLFVALCVLMLIISACSNQKINEENFYEMYKEILIIRKENEDTVVANPLVRELYEKYDYTQEQFRIDFLELSKDSETFRKKIDSIRNVVNNMP